MEVDYNRCCPHCGVRLESWMGPPETGWGELLVCNNNECMHYLTSNDCCVEHGASPRYGFRYAEDTMNNYAPFNLVSYYPASVAKLRQEKCGAK
jgi:hypothetical protein